MYEAKLLLVKIKWNMKWKLKENSVIVQDCVLGFFHTYNVTYYYSSLKHFSNILVNIVMTF